MSQTPDVRSRHEIGSHVMTAERNGVLHLVVKGMVNARDAEKIQSAMSEHADHHLDFDFIAIVSDMTGIDDGGRRQFVHPAKPYPFRRCYIVGSSFAIRTVIQGIYRAGRALRPDYFAWLMFTVATEDEARRLIAANQFAKTMR